MNINTTPSLHALSDNVRRAKTVPHKSWTIRVSLAKEGPDPRAALEIVFFSLYEERL